MHNDIRFLRLLDEVERQGGAHLPGACKPQTIKYPKHTETFLDDDGEEFTVQFGRVESIQTTGCGREQRFEIPDIMFAGEGDEPARTTTVCYKDDGMAYWPRFAAIHDPDAD